MSKRGSRNAINFAGKNWTFREESAQGAIDHKQLRAKIRGQKKDARLESRWIRLCEKFKYSLEHEQLDTSDNLKSRFYMIKGNTNNLKALQNVKSFRLYCKKYNEVFSLENYLVKQYYAVNYKKDFPDV